jgi:hypothetical protein
LETPFLRTGRKRGLPGVATAVRAIEKLAVPGVYSVGIAHAERAAATHDRVVPALRPAAFDKQARPLLAARRDRPLALIDDQYRQFRLLNFVLTAW